MTETKTNESERTLSEEELNAETGAEFEEASADRENADDTNETDSGEKGEEKGADKADGGSDEKVEREDHEESERYMRLMAEFQNYKKRVAKEKSDIHSYANEGLISELLVVLDNFERALDHDGAGDPEGYAKGMELILTQMLDVLNKAGLKEIIALGEEFDPNIHNAVMTEDSGEYESGKISKVMQKGYTLNGKVIRPSMVAVVK